MKEPKYGSVKAARERASRGRELEKRRERERKRERDGLRRANTATGRHLVIRDK